MSEEDTEKSPTYEYDFTNCVTVRTGIFDKNDVIVAIQAASGNMAAVGRLLQKPRRAVVDYISKHQDLLLLKEDILQGKLDDLEDATMLSALRGDGANGRFLLTTLAKDRGYVTRTESDLTHKVDPSLQAMLERVASNGRKLVE